MSTLRITLISAVNGLPLAPPVTMEVAHDDELMKLDEKHRISVPGGGMPKLIEIVRIL